MLDSGPILEIFDQTKVVPNLVMPMINWEYGNDSFLKHLPEYLRLVKKHYSNSSDIFGLKTNYFDFIRVINQGLDIFECDREIKFIKITRDDIVAQAVSIVFSSQLSECANQDKSELALHFDFELIDRMVGILSYWNSSWEEFFSRNNITPCRVSYERLINEGEQELRRVVEFFGISDKFSHPPDNLSSKFEMQLITEDQKNICSHKGDWIGRYLRIKNVGLGNEALGHSPSYEVHGAYPECNNLCLYRYSYTISGKNNLHPLLGEGWHAPENALVWSSEQTATLSFSLPWIKRSAVAIELQLNPVSIKLEKSCKISVLVNKFSVGNQIIERHSQKIIFEVDSKYFRLTDNLLEIVVEEVTTPKNLGLGQDQRQLGVGLSSFRISEINGI